MAETGDMTELSLPLVQQTADGAGDQPLPVPESERFLPLRAGILNLWQFENQELRFHRGRLILRGENGTGKSKALELLLPFLLDADLSPQRLDPFASTARSMTWNLLEDRFESRQGYVWLELGRRDEEGDESYLTLGCGLKASKHTQRVDSWYFLTSQRVGAELELLTGRQPWSKEQLRAALGDGSELFGTGRDYRERLDRRIFRLGDDRFAALRHLLLQLRRPHLSEKLDPGSLSDLLTESLPPLDPDLVGEVAESFERLERDRSELARITASVESVTGFVDIYREYARGVARARAAGVRQADSRYHNTAAEVREAEEAQEAAGGRRARLEEEDGKTGATVVESRAALRALDQSEAMRQAEALSAKRDRAADLERAAERDAADVERETAAEKDRHRERQGAESAAEAARESAAAEGARARGAAEAVGLEAVHEAAAEVLPQSPEPAQGTVRAALRERRTAVDELLELRRQRDESRRRHQVAEERRRETRAQAEGAEERRRSADAAVEESRRRLLEELETWFGALSELQLSEDERQRLAERVEAEEVGDLAATVATLAAPARDRRIARRVSLDAEMERVEAERAVVEAERAEVAAAREVPPPAPRWRSADRTGRAGAPFYRLCDFAPHLSPAERAGLEAALEAAGLLDAWVSPAGHVLDPETLDTRWRASPRRGPGTLGEALVPVPGHGVGEEEIVALLASIDLVSLAGAAGGPAKAPATDPEEGRPHRLSPDGRFELGPLAGAAAKAEAELLGAGAREAARQRRLEELAQRLEELAAQLDGLREQRREQERRLEDLDAEVASVPATAALARLQADARGARGEEERRRQELAEAEGRAAEARRQREKAEEELERRARELQLAPFVDDLESYRDALRSYEAVFAGWLRALAEDQRAREQENQARALWEQAQRRRKEAERRARAAGDGARAAASEYRTLEAAVGAETREILERRQRTSERLDSLEQARERLRGELQEAGEELARLDERQRLKTAEREEHGRRRDRAVFHLQRLGQVGLLSLLDAPLPEEPPQQWSLTRSLELARSLEQELSSVDLAESAVQRRANRLHERFQLLVSDLGAEFQPSLGQEDEGLMIVRVTHNRAQLDPRELLETLTREAEVRRELLAREERELLLRFLLGEIGDHLRQRLRQARELVDEMNTELAACATASGMTLKLDWKPRNDDDSPARTVVPLLAQSAEMLVDRQRRQLQDFFHHRILEAREQWQAVPWREHLLEALDYRRWHRFRLLRRDPVSSIWRELSQRSHAASSGGEKAVALHLPLFAAAAAHYRSADPGAPRLILLDEAFAGIDDGMRGRLMALLVRFDLDFMMTSHDEWGCYRELPGVATYHLSRDPTLRGVLATRFVWDGERLAEDARSGS